MKNIKSVKVNYLIVVLLAVAFGLGSGISGGLITRSYIMNDIYSIPFFGKINVSSSQDNKSSLLIDSRGVTVEQDNRVKSTISSAGQSIVGIFKKIETSQSLGDAGFNKDKYYKLGNSITEGLIVTSDGWILISDFGEVLSDKYLLDNFVGITKDKKVYEISEIFRTGDNDFIFLRLKDAKDLPVRQFASGQSLGNGQLVVALSWDELSHITYISNVNKKSAGIKSSDIFNTNFSLSDDLGEIFKRAFVFDLNGNFIAILDGQQELKSSEYFSPIVKNLLNKEDRSRPGLGVNYINLSDYVITDTNARSKGALVYRDANGIAVAKNSSAAKAGLLEGDIILSINNIEINQNNDLADLISQYLEGDEIDLLYLREEEERRIKIKLSSY